MRYRVVDHSGSQGCDRADGIRPGVDHGNAQLMLDPDDPWPEDYLIAETWSDL